MGEEKHSLEKVVKVNEDKCEKCFNCISVCPAKFCNEITDNAIIINDEMCIGCGKCIDACKNRAREYVDDFETFLEKLDKNKKIVAIVSPAGPSYFEDDFLRLNGWLKSLGVEEVFDISFGAELTVMSYVKYIMFNDPDYLIASSCPSINEYIQIYKEDLVDQLAPLDSSVIHTIKMINEYHPEYSSYEKAVISPCISRKRELNRVGLGNYNITFASINRYLDKNEIDLEDFNKNYFANEPPERAVTFPIPGGMTHTIERWMPDITSKARQISGENRVYNYLEDIGRTYNENKKVLPQLLECWNCSNGCNNGPGVLSGKKSLDEIEYWIKNREQKMRRKHRLDGGGGNKDARRHVENILDDYWEDNLYDREFKKLGKNNLIEIPNKNELTQVYHKLNKYEEEDIKDCTLCGYDSCEDMAIAIYNDLNQPEHCYFYLRGQYTNASEEIERTQEMMDEIIQSLPFGVLIVDRNNKIIDMNEAAEAITEYKRQNLLNENYEELLCLDNSDIFQELQKSEEYINQKCKIEKKNGSKRNIMKSVIPIDYHGENCILISFIDITEMERAEQKVKEMNKELEKMAQERTEELEQSLEELKQAKREAEEAKEKAQESDRLKSEFLANMSHEIRTPMNSIIGFTKVLLNEIEEEENKEHLEMIYNSGKNLLSLINDILDISKIEAGKMELDPHPFSLKKLIEQFSKMFEQRAQKKGLYFNTRIGDKVPEYVLGDESRINQILINLAGNAIKFTEEGGILISCHYETEKGEAVISVKDTGIGIPPEKQEKIFKPFRQADASTTRKFGGTGLGLAISMELIGLMNGDLELESEEGMGSNFIIHLPLPETSPPKEGIEIESEEELDFSGRKIGIVEDEDTDRTLLKKILKKNDYVPITLDNTKNINEEVIEEDIDLIILDLIMESPDGFTLNEILKKDPRTAHLPVVVCSSSDKASDSIYYGIMDYIQKPINEEEILQHIYSALAVQKQVKNVFVIDDDEQLTKLYSNYLNDHNYRAFVYNDAEEALKEIREGKLPDLIIQDLKMPGMDGFEFLQELRKEYSSEEIPVIVVTAKELDQKEMQELKDKTLTIFTKGGETENKFIRYLDNYFELSAEKGEKIFKKWEENFKSDERQVERFYQTVSAIPDLIEKVEKAIDERNPATLKKYSKSLRDLLSNNMMDEMAKPANAVYQAANEEEVNYDKVVLNFSELNDIYNIIPNKYFQGKVQAEETSEKEQKEPETEEEEIEGSKEKISVLIAEDNPTNQKLLNVYFKRMNLECEIVENGKLALEELENDEYNLLFLDMQMPVMDGMETLEKINKEDISSPYIVALTAHAMKGDEEKYLEAGCDEYMSKPIEYEELENRINSIKAQLNLE